MTCCIVRHTEISCCCDSYALEQQSSYHKFSLCCTKFVLLMSIIVAAAAAATTRSSSIMILLFFPYPFFVVGDANTTAASCEKIFCSFYLHDHLRCSYRYLHVHLVLLCSLIYDLRVMSTGSYTCSV